MYFHRSVTNLSTYLSKTDIMKKIKTAFMAGKAPPIAH